MFFPFFAQEINIVKDILVKPAVARLAEPGRDRMAVARLS